jgi:hypothetical protein
MSHAREGDATRTAQLKQLTPLLALLALMLAAGAVLHRRGSGRLARSGELDAARLAHGTLVEELDIARLAAEYARIRRLAENDALALDEDFQWIALIDSKALANLDWDNDSTELINVANDSGVLHVSNPSVRERHVGVRE